MASLSWTKGEFEYFKPIGLLGASSAEFLVCVQSQAQVVGFIVYVS